MDRQEQQRGQNALGGHAVEAVSGITEGLGRVLDAAV